MELPQKVKKCCGWGSDFAEKYSDSPHNIIVRHCDRRLMRRDKRSIVRTTARLITISTLAIFGRKPSV